MCDSGYLTGYQTSQNLGFLSVGSPSLVRFHSTSTSVFYLYTCLSLLTLSRSVTYNLYEWYAVMSGSKNRNQKDMCLKEIGLCALTNLSFQNSVPITNVTQPIFFFFAAYHLLIPFNVIIIHFIQLLFRFSYFSYFFSHMKHMCLFTYLIPFNFHSVFLFVHVPLFAHFISIYHLYMSGMHLRVDLRRESK